MRLDRFGLSDYYSGDIAQACHWCPLSQPYAGVDALLGCLDEGWEITGDVYFDQHWFGESRRICVCRFNLMRHNDCVIMRVVWNPVLDRLLAQLPQKRLSPACQQVSNGHFPRLDAQVSVPVGL